ncbi:MAG: CDP-glucose 4,6-dehydratase [Chitinophagaceae bacterium]
MNYGPVFRNTYQGKKILLTGHTGFKGSWMLAWLHHLGAHVKGFALKPENENNLYNLLKADAWCESHIADIRDAEKVKKVIDDFQPDFIFHLAAQSLVRVSYDQPLYTFETNLLGTANILEATRFLEKPCVVVVVTTDKVYENREIDYPYKEEDKLGGYDPYSASKAAAEIVTSGYRNSFFNPEKYASHQKSVASARAGNVIGGGDRAKDRIIPDIIRAFENNGNVILRNPESVRPWQHVLEPVSGYLLLAAKMFEHPNQFNSSWNFGPYADDVLTVKEVTEEAIKILGKGKYSIAEKIDQPHEASMLKLDIHKSIRELGWTPKMNSSEAISNTINWYKKASDENAIALTTGQILKYEETL